MTRNQRLSPGGPNKGRGWLSVVTYLAGCALAATIVLGLGTLFLTVMPPSAGQLLDRQLQSAQELVSTTVFAIAGVMAMRSALQNVSR